MTKKRVSNFFLTLKPEKEGKKKITVYWNGYPMTFGRGFCHPKKNLLATIRELNEEIRELKEYHNNL